MRRTTGLLSASVVLFLLLAGHNSFANDGDRVQIGKSLYVAQNEAVGDLVCIGCSIHMAGTCGDVVAIGGSVSIDGDAKGDVVAILGGIRLDQDATVSGDVVTIGGKFLRHPDSVVKGDIQSRSAAPYIIGFILVPLLPFVLIVALIVWLVRRNRRNATPYPAQPVR